MVEEIFISPKIKVKPSSLHGMGVFAIDSILANEVVEVCYCTIDDLWKYETTILNKYLFKGGRIVWGYGSIYNHSFEPNLDWEVSLSSEKVIIFKAIKNIKIGEELTHCYNKDTNTFKKKYLSTWQHPIQDYN